MRLRLKQAAPILCLILAAVLVVPSTLSIYRNLKKDNLDGRGSIKVTSCQHTGPWDYDFRCAGSYMQGSGMVEFGNATVHVSQDYQPGDVIQDVYRDVSRGETSSANQRYSAGDTRRGVMHNLPATVAALLGVEIGTGSLAWLLISARRRQSAVTNPGDNHLG